jgi:hypothetical protein
MRVLIVWSEVPESTALYLLEDVSEEDCKRLEQCHDHMINQTNAEDVDSALRWLYEKLTGRDYLTDEQFHEGVRPIYNNSTCSSSVITQMPRDVGPLDMVILTGFIL